MDIKIKENTAVEKAFEFSELGFKICFLLFGLVFIKIPKIICPFLRSKVVVDY